MDGLATIQGAQVKARMYRMLPVLALLAVVVEGLGAGVGETPASNPFAFARLISYGRAPAAIAFALGTILADGIRRKPPERIAFNAAQYVITVAAAGVVLSAL